MSFTSACAEKSDHTERITVREKISVDNFILSKPNKAVATLAELAVEINAEHGQVETALRDGVAHAKRAGVLLLEAKARVPHGNWLSWLEQNCKTTSRTAQRYMQLADRWDEIVSKGGDTFGLHRALRLVSAPDNDPDVPNASSVSYLPPALAYYRENDLITDKSLQQLLGLAQDYGPEILTDFKFSDATEALSFEFVHLLNAIRPLDRPSLWPLVDRGDAAAAAILTTATKIFLDDGRARANRVPQWEICAFWFCSTLVYLAATNSEVESDFATILRHNLALWREAFQAALAMVAFFGRDIPNGEDSEQFWLGCLSDLRHAGVLPTAENLIRTKSQNVNLYASLRAGVREVGRLGGYLPPSSMR
jgi:hypothetical protein